MSGAALALNLAIEAITLLAKLDANLPAAISLAQNVAALLRHGGPGNERAVRTQLAALTPV